MSSRILIVDDDPHIREVVQFAIENAGMHSQQAKDGVEALSHIASYNPDLIILDISMPEMDGVTLCKTVRQHSEVPVLFLSSRDDEIDRVIGFEVGADDYVTKPFSPRELVSRVKAILKRTQKTQQSTVNSADIISYAAVQLDQEGYQLSYKGHIVPVTATEFSIVRTLLSRPSKVYSRDDLVNQAYDQSINISDRTVDSHIRNIRKKFSHYGCDSIIETVHGIGVKAGTCD